MPLRPALAVRLPGGVVGWLIAGGCALGVSARLVDVFAPRWIGNLGAAWFAAGFLAGRQAPTPGRGAQAGSGCLSVAAISYYALRLAVDPISVGDLVPVPLLWLIVGAAVGVVSGWLGARSTEHVEAWGAPAGVFLGEALAVLVLRQRVAQALLEIATAGALLWIARPSLRRALVIAATAIPYVAAFAALYRIVLW